MTKKYFAYGSNMSVSRLCKRVPSAKAIGIYTLPEHDLRFHKLSKKDCSGKCDAFCTGNANDAVIGRLFTIDHNEECELDRFEGLDKGYNKKEVRVVGENGEPQNAFTYCADCEYIDNNLHPYTWYKKHVLVGAEQGGLPADYIKKIEAVTAVKDPDSGREEKEMKLHSQSSEN